MCNDQHNPRRHKHLEKAPTLFGVGVDALVVRLLFFLFFTDLIAFFYGSGHFTWCSA
jgi:hypothetical protein